MKDLDEIDGGKETGQHWKKAWKCFAEGLGLWLPFLQQQVHREEALKFCRVPRFKQPILNTSKYH